MSILEDPRVTLHMKDTYNIDEGMGFSAVYTPEVSAWRIYNCYGVWVGKRADEASTSPVAHEEAGGVHAAGTYGSAEEAVGALLGTPQP